MTSLMRAIAEAIESESIHIECSPTKCDRCRSILHNQPVLNALLAQASFIIQRSQQSLQFLILGLVRSVHQPLDDLVEFGQLSESNQSAIIPKIKPFFEVLEIVADMLYFGLFHIHTVQLTAVEKARNSRVFPCLAATILPSISQITLTLSLVDVI